MDHSDRITDILSRLSPTVEPIRHDIERAGTRGSLDWFPAFGFDEKVATTGSLIVLENAPLSALMRLQDEQGRPLAKALPDWVRQGGHLLIVGGSPSIESYAGSPLTLLMGFEPSRDVRLFAKKKTRRIVSRAPDIEISDVHVDFLHSGRVTDAHTLLEAGGDPFLIENKVGRGRVTTLLSGAQLQRRRDGGEHVSEWFMSPAWAETLRRVVINATGRPHQTDATRRGRPAVETPPRDSFDVRYFAIGHHPYPYGYAAGEAYDRASELRAAGFTSVVFTVNWSRPADDRRALEEIADAGLRVIYYDGIRRESPDDRFPTVRDRPKRAHDRTGRYVGWDIDDPHFQNAPMSLLEGRGFVRELPLRALQIIEEFQDGDMIGPVMSKVLQAQEIPPTVAPGSPAWIRAAVIRADATNRTFQRFREIGKQLFPELPQSTYWPGSYWRRPLDYGYRLTALADAADELLGPGYGYDTGNHEVGSASVRRSATETWVALRDSPTALRHMAVYAQGRPITRNGRDSPNLSSQIETAWTALAHGSTGLAYWALPRGESTQRLGPFHREIHRVGPWLRPLARESAPIALLESWTSRSESGDPAVAAAMSTCLQQTLHSLELGFEDVDVIFEERLDRVPEATQLIVVVSTPAISEAAAESLSRFLQRGGHVFIDIGSAVRTQPGAHALDLAQRSGRPAQIHSLPIASHCTAARISSRIAAGSWQRALDDFGLHPRVRTRRFETEATLRGTPELAHLYLVNHAEEPLSLTVTLEGNWEDRTWVNLRTGETVMTPNGSFETPRTIESGDGEVWASVRRPLDRLEVSVVEPTGTPELEILGFDDAGRPLANAYPLRASLRTKCAPGYEASITLSEGRATLPIARCPNQPYSQIEWTFDDPISGRRFQSSAADSTGGSAGGSGARNLARQDSSPHGEALR